jgi:hypothetical protein
VTAVVEVDVRPGEAEGLALAETEREVGEPQRSPPVGFHGGEDGRKRREVERAGSASGFGRRAHELGDVAPQPGHLVAERVVERGPQDGVRVGHRPR